MTWRLVVAGLLLALTACSEPAPPAAPAAPTGYADVQDMFDRWFIARGGGHGLPHRLFWDLPYEEFIAFEFPRSWDEPDTMIKLLEVGRSADSQLVKALRRDWGERAMPVEDVARLAAWIDAGCPEHGGPD